ncbi:MAG: thioredoxin [Chloroflexi bacterium]|jgi:thioredoxin 1|nr:thioredoxin [Chloroflexota bacterium]
MAHPVAISDASFDQEVVKASRPVLVDFWAEWCGPCRMIAPVLEQLAEEYADSLKIVKLDVDNNPEMAEQFDVVSIPTMILFKDGKPVERMIGYVPKTRLVNKIKPHIGAAARA